jgi:hypothetical protein
MTALAATLLLPLMASLVVSSSAEAGARPQCDGRAATLVGTSGRDRLVGSDGPDVILGLGERDVIDGRGGDDLICGGDGNDVLLGGPGDDRLLGQRAGLKWDRGGSTLKPNRLVGGPGDDYLDPGLDNRKDDEGGSWGFVDYTSSPSALRMDLSGAEVGTVTGAGRDVVRIRSRVFYVASRHDDVMIGTSRNDYLVGGAGNDEMHGGDGNDVLMTELGDFGPSDNDVAYGDAGKDEIVTSTGSDVVHGGPGNDIVGSYSAQPTQVYGEDGDDDIVLTVTPGPGYVGDGGAGHDVGELTTSDRDREHGARVDLEAATGALTRDGVQTGTWVGIEEVTLDGSLSWFYHGTDGPDVVSGGYDRALTAYTNGGDDVVVGSEMNDYIDAGDGNDDVTGKDGQDTCLHAEKLVTCEVTS